VSKEELLKRVWPDTFVEEGSLSQNISILRKTLGEHGDSQYIETVSKRGYRFAAPLKLPDAPPEAQVARSVLNGQPQASPDQVPEWRPVPLLRWALIGAAAMALALVALGGIYWREIRPVYRPLQPLMRLSVDLGPDAVAGQFLTTAISRDGTRLVFPIKALDGRRMLATRLLDETKPALLAGTENGSDPFFSPDGKWIGFFAEGKMKKSSVQGGSPVVLCDAPNARGADWADDGNIIAALNIRSALSRIPSEGGSPQAVTRMQGAVSHRWPQSLPGNESVLFTLAPSIVSLEEASIAAVSLKTGQIKILVRGGYSGRYLPTGNSIGHLVYVHEGYFLLYPSIPHGWNFAARQCLW